MFSVLDAAGRAFVCERFVTRSVPGGAVLMEQGDAGDSMYLVAVGRLRVTMTHEDGSEAVVAELGSGEVVGELAVLTDEPRSATVTALRDSHVLELSAADFADLVALEPGNLRRLTTRIVRRLVRSLREGSPTSPVVTIAVVPLSDDSDTAAFAERLQAALERLGNATGYVTLDEAERALGALPHVPVDQLASWFGAHEAGLDVVVYAASSHFDEWTDACVRQADLVLLVGAASESPTPRSVEQAIAERRARVPIRTELVLLHASGTRDPRGTSWWLLPRAVDRHHHVRVDRDADVDRVARLLMGRGGGVVFSGGGARGVAAIGVLDALRERGIPIDACGGTSIGALIAGGAARGLTTEQLAAQLRAAVLDTSPFDVTFPALSLATGRRVTDAIRTAADGLDLEDCWRNLYCISTNLTTAAAEVHRTGPGWQAIRASFSIPGLFPPVRNAKGELLVDGGLLDNLPVAWMREDHRNITVVAVDTGRTRDMVAGSLPPDGIVSGWRLLMSRVDPTARGMDTAGLGRVLMRLTELGSERGRDAGDVYIRPDVDGFGIAEFKAFDRLIALGREAGRRAIDEWQDA